MLNLDGKPTTNVELAVNDIFGRTINPIEAVFKDFH
jgi:hypothetical protein